MVPLLVIRPEPGCSATVAAARAAGLDARAHPLFAVAARSWQAPPPARYDALLVGSANVFRHGGPALAAFRTLPVLAVGEATAAAARDAGFAVGQIGTGGLQGVLDRLDPQVCHLLRLAGEERVALSVPRGVTMDERVVYASVPRPLGTELAELLRHPAIVAVHSAESARHLTAQCVANGISRARLRLATLGPRIAAAAGDGWGEVAVAAGPGDGALLALARQMCQDPWPAG